MDFWLSWAYSYGVGGVIAGISFYLMISRGALRLDRAGDRKLLFGLVAGFAAFLTFHGLWVYNTLPSGVAE